MVVDAKQKASQHRKKKYPQSAEEVTRPNKCSGRNRGNKYYDKDEKSLLRRQIDTELRVQVAMPQTCYEMNSDKYCNYYSSHSDNVKTALRVFIIIALSAAQFRVLR